MNNVGSSKSKRKNITVRTKNHNVRKNSLWDRWCSFVGRSGGSYLASSAAELIGQRRGNNALSFWTAIACVLLGVMALCGHIFHIPILYSLVPGIVPTTKVITAFMFIIIGTSLVAGHTRWVTLSLSLAMLTLIMTGMTLVVSVITTPGPTNPLIDESKDIVQTFKPGVPSLGTLLAFALAACGTIIGTLGNGPMRSIRRGIGWLVAGGGAFALVGYILNVDLLYWFIPGVSSAISALTAIGLILMGTSIHELEALVNRHHK